MGFFQDPLGTIKRDPILATGTGAAVGFVASGGNPMGAFYGGTTGLAYQQSKKQQREQSKAADRAAEAGAFDPYNVTTGVGTSYFDTATNTAGTTLNPEYQQIRDGFLSGAQNTQAVPVSQQIQGIGSNALNTSLNLFSQVGGSGLTQEQQNLQDMYMNQSQGFLGALGSYDPAAAAREQYDRLTAISAPQEERARQANESSLFSRGLMGSTAGYNQQLAFETAANMRDLARENQAFTQAQSVQGSLLNNAVASGSAMQGLGLYGQDLQNQLMNRGSTLFNIGNGIETMGQQREINALGLQNSYLNGALGLDRAGISGLELGAQFGGRAAQAGQFGANLQFQATQNNLDANAALYSGLLNTVSSGLGSYFSQPSAGATPFIQSTPYVDPYSPNSLFGSGMQQGLGY